MQNFIPLTSSKFYNEICVIRLFFCILNNLIENFLSLYLKYYMVLKYIICGL